MKKVVLFSTKHRADDNRIIELEANPLALNGFDVVVFGNTDNITYPYNYLRIEQCESGFVNRLRQMINEKASLYIFQDPDLILYAVILRILGKKCVFDSHENYEEKLKTRLPNKCPWLRPIRKPLAKMWWVYEKISVSLLSGKVCADRTVKAKYGKNVYLLPNMPSSHFYMSLPDRANIDTMFNIIYVGSISWDRGLIQTIEAIKLCKHKNIVFSIIGDTDDEKLKDTLKNDENVIWNGRVEWSKLKYYLVNADLGVVLLQPTEAYTYCSGENIVKLWEYMSIGIPVLISDFPKLNILNKELKFGINVKPDDIQEIANAIDWIIDHPKERLEFGKNGRDAVYNYFNAEHFTEGFVTYIESLA